MKNSLFMEQYLDQLKKLNNLVEKLSFNSPKVRTSKLLNAQLERQKYIVELIKRHQFSQYGEIRSSKDYEESINNVAFKVSTILPMDVPNVELDSLFKHLISFVSQVPRVKSVVELLPVDESLTVKVALMGLYVKISELLVGFLNNDIPPKARDLFIGEDLAEEDFYFILGKKVLEKRLDFIKKTIGCSSLISDESLVIFSLDIRVSTPLFESAIRHARSVVIEVVKGNKELNSVLPDKDVLIEHENSPLIYLIMSKFNRYDDQYLSSVMEI
ncbi:MAG: hypothetical protein IBX55_01430 [Methyloprofundus sp.]|nr:hypothetical protein [Methyloprofundus sp.]